MFQKYRSRCCYIICVLFSNKYWVQISGVLWHVSIWMAVWVSPAEVGRLSWSVAESFRAFVERVNANFRDKNVVFYNPTETDNLWLSKDFYESRMAFVKSSTKAGSEWLLLKALRKQDDFGWKLYEGRMSFSESSTKAGCLLVKALRKQDGLR